MAMRRRKRKIPKSGISAKWQKLCVQHQAARDAYFKAFSPVNRKFLKIGGGESRDNPTESELSKLDSAWKKWEDIKRRMRVFAKKYA